MKCFNFSNTYGRKVAFGSVYSRNKQNSRQKRRENKKIKIKIIKQIKKIKKIKIVYLNQELKYLI